MKRRTPARTALVIAAVLAIVAATAPPASAAPAHARVEGDGSSWSGNAVAVWVADVNQQGLQVSFTPTGSSTGRKDFANLSVDFAVSDIGYQGSDPLNGADDSAKGRAYSYVPIVAGGTAFPYQIRVGGQLVRDLRLSGETLAKIFTQQITNWNDQQITDDNNGRKLPSLAIIPVVHSEGSGSTAQFTAFLAKRYPDLWTRYAGKDVATEYFPVSKIIPGQMISKEGSDSVMSTVLAKASNGAIGFDEYSYALDADKFPVAKIENAAGYYTLPTDFNVAVALTKAVINKDPTSKDYLLQSLDNVYVYDDPRTYPLSSYSYLILPTGAVNDGHETKMTTAKRQTLADFMSYAICTGQEPMGRIGYSPLPINLVQAGFEQVQRLHTADPGVVVTNQAINSCNNPTFIAGHPETNHLAEIAPQPPACDKQGAGPCKAATATTPGSNNGGTTSTTAAAGTGAGAAGAGTGTGTSAPAAASGTHIDPDTGQVVSNGNGTGGGDVNAVGVPSDLAAFKSGKHMRLLGPFAAVLLLLIVFGPAALSRWLGRRREQSGPGRGRP